MSQKDLSSEDQDDLPVACKVALSELLRDESEAARLIGAVRGCSTTLDDLNYTNSMARQGLNTVLAKLQDVKHVANNQDQERHRAIMLARAGRTQRHVTSMNRSLREVAMEAKKRIDQRQKADRERLLNGSIMQKSSGKSLIGTSMQASASMRDASKVMAELIQESLAAKRKLAESSNVITKTKEEMKMLDGELDNSRHVITKLQRREFINNALIILGLSFFALTVAYILKKRLVPSLPLFSPLWTILSWIWGMLFSSGEGAGE
ncbi:hypothetical protein SARC_09920 [Sphaeroforma arctica JP610]|uniref:Sec20 C-terminal domain-containing protein n=1 Tax=Sphaeroforma arctica JP610 TaxID=667725 RepID=A0A0L0FLH0_9EUKA|nr:hypothetical protein SARC_09920 [Sphaeroforma arctica JP610]KNC77622.1 hypothetical protein SARC_09920 [Sphaeroforma arctica JP610]|eukprot:XP_014151524.1 hypothetical protein SARC_09920 [Sphaeroforma arctica JP610]